MALLARERDTPFVVDQRIPLAAGNARLRMKAEFQSLFAALREARRLEPLDLIAAVQALPPVARLPSPWETWTLIGLVRHRRRQLWVGDTITARLGANLLELGRMGALGHPPVPQSGPVPGLPEWEYYFHGKGCCLTHKVTGEAIDVDFFDDSAEYFDLWFYQNHLKSLRDLPPPERRLLDLHPSVEPIRLAAENLLRAGVLAPLPGRDAFPFRVADPVLEYEEDVTLFGKSWADQDRRLWLAALVGDWPAAHDEAVRRGDPMLIEVTAARDAQCRALRQERLLLARREEGLAPEALRGLADLRSQALPGVLSEALRGPTTGLTSAALDIIQRLDDPAWCDKVHELFCQVDPAGASPQPHLWMAALKFLLRHGHNLDEVLAALPRAGGYEMGEACLLALEHAPRLALPLIRRALCSGVPANRTAVAAILALIDRPWSRRELVANLETFDDQEMTADCRAALLECRDEEAHRAVRAWEERNPHEPEAPTFLQIGDREYGPCISMGEMMLRDRAQRVRYEMEQMHDRVMKVRDIVPPEPNASLRPWWQFWRH